MVSGWFDYMWLLDNEFYASSFAKKADEYNMNVTGINRLFCLVILQLMYFIFPVFGKKSPLLSQPYLIWQMMV